ncbi:hypothetical protein C4K24_5243 [Pseudomonas chlororaphis subsp. aurantiaca]|nr:hypothetical protein C4K24_5243 [Pseudomonas chlororaphis subsp. aurantiaca]
MTVLATPWGGLGVEMGDSLGVDPFVNLPGLARESYGEQ